MPYKHNLDRLTRERAEALLERMRHVRVLVVGDLMLDVYLRGQASRISPEAPVPVVRIEEEWRAPGGAANVAANVVALGGRCTLAGCIGEDVWGQALRRELTSVGVADDGILAVAGRRTTVKTRVLVRHQQVARYDAEDEHDIDDATVARLAAVVTSLVGACDALVLEDYDKGVLVPALIRPALAAAVARGVPSIVDPKIRNFFEYGGATVFKPNLAELSGALRARVLPNDAAWMRRVREELGCAHLLVTLGEEGMSLATQAGDHFRVPTVARSVYDVSGAGDTVTAVVALTLAAGGSPEEAAVLANHAAGIEVGKAGVATISPDELRAVVREHHDGARDAVLRAGAGTTPSPATDGS